VLLIDGNIGIGADPARLLWRAGELLAQGGQLIVETEPEPARNEVLDVRFTEHGRPVGPTFGWALVGLEPLRDYAARARCRVLDSWSTGARTFAVITHPPGSTT
jgi:hypothetical protein